MKLLVNVRSLKVTQLAQGVSWNQIKGVTNNGQHAQLAETILVEYHPSEDEIVLLHPETDASTGHQDVIYSGRRRKWGGGVSFYTYQRRVITNLLSDDVYRYWPDGPEHLIRTIIAIEEYLAKEVEEYDCTLLHHVVMNFMTM